MPPKKGKKGKKKDDWESDQEEDNKVIADEEPSVQAAPKKSNKKKDKGKKKNKDDWSDDDAEKKLEEKMKNIVLSEDEEEEQIKISRGKKGKSKTKNNKKNIVQEESSDEEMDDADEDSDKQNKSDKSGNFKTASDSSVEKEVSVTKEMPKEASPPPPVAVEESSEEEEEEEEETEEMKQKKRRQAEKEALKKLTHKERKKMKQQLEYERQMEVILQKGGKGTSSLDDTFSVSQVEKSDKQKDALENAVDIKSMNELDASGLTATLLAAVIDLQVTGVRSGDEKKLVADLYTKLTAMFDQSSEKLCDCLLLCRCLIYKNHRKPRVLIPLIRQVLLRGGSSHSSIRCISGPHYIKLLLLAKIWLFMVDTNEVSAVRSLVAGALKVPAFFRDWLDQNDISWLRQTDKNLKVKNILKCMTVSNVLETLYGANKVTCETSPDIKQESQIDVPQVKEEKMEIKDLVTKTKKKHKKRALTHEEKLEDTEPTNKKSKTSSSLEEAQSNSLKVENKKTKKEKRNSSFPCETVEIMGNNSKELVQNDVNKGEKRKKKKKDKCKEDNLYLNSKLHDVIKTDVQHNNLVIGSATKKNNKKDKKSKEKLISENCESNTDNCANLNEVLINEPIENVNGEPTKKKKKKRNKSHIVNADSTVELNDCMENLNTGVSKSTAETIDYRKIKDNENNINEGSLISVNEASQPKDEIISANKDILVTDERCINKGSVKSVDYYSYENEVVSEPLKKKKKNKKSDKFTAEDNIDWKESVENLNPGIVKTHEETFDIGSSTKNIVKDIENETPCENNEEIANSVNEDGWIVVEEAAQPKNEVTSVKKEKSVTGWNVSPTSHQNTSYNMLGDFTITPVNKCKKRVKQKGSAEDSSVTPPVTKSDKNKVCVESNAFQISMESVICNKTVEGTESKMSINKKNKQVAEQGIDDLEMPPKFHDIIEKLIDLEDTSSSSALDPSQIRGRSREHLTPMQSKDRSRSRGRRIFTPESSKWSSPRVKERERKLSGSTPELQKEKKSSLSKEEFISHRKRVRRDSLTFTVTELTEEEIAFLKEKEKGILLPEKDYIVEKVSLGIQTDVSSFNESECDVKVMKSKTGAPNKPVDEINKDCKVLKPILSTPGSYKVLKLKTELMKEKDNSGEQSSEIQKDLQTDVILNQNEIDKSQEVLKPDLVSNQNINESDSDIEVMEEIIIVHSTSESDIDEASGTESDIVPCDDNLKMFTDEENKIYHEKLKEEERKRKEAEMEHVVQEMLKKEEKEVQERIIKLSETEQGTTPEKTINKNVKAEVDSNQMLSKLYSIETRTCVSKEDKKQSVSDNEEKDENEDIEVVLQTIVSDTGRVESVQGLREQFTTAGEAEINKENVEPNGNDSEVQIVEEKGVRNENELKVEIQSSNDECAADICELKKTKSDKELKNEPRSGGKSNSKTSDAVIVGSNQEFKPETKEETVEPLKISGGDSENNVHRKKIEKSALKEAIENNATLMNNNMDKVPELVEGKGAENEVISCITEAEEELSQSKLSTDDDVCTTQEKDKAWLSDLDEAYEASSDASEEQPRTPTHAIRKKMSERKRSAAVVNTQIASDSDMSPVRATQRGMRSADKSKNRKKDNIQNSSVINFNSLDESMTSISLLKNINDSSLESIFSSTSIVSTDKQTDGSCATVIPAPTTTINTNANDTVKDSMQNNDSDTLESKNDSSMVSEDRCDNSKTALDIDKTVVAETMSSDVTEEFIEEELIRNDAANMSGIFDSATNSKIIENENTESLLLSKDRVDIDEDEELEVLSTDGEEYFSISPPRVTRSKNTLSASCQQVSPHGSFGASLKSTSRRRRSSQTPGKIVGNTEDKIGSPALAPQSQRLAAQALHKELIISPDVSDEECELVSPEINGDNQDQAIETADNSETEDSFNGFSSIQSPAKTASPGWLGVSSGRIRSPQKMIPEEQDETQPKLTRSRQQQQSKVLDSLSFLSSKGEKTSPKTRTRSRSNSLTGIGQKYINSTPTKGTNQTEKLSPKLNRMKSTPSKNNNSPLRLENNIDTEENNEEIVESKQVKKKPGRPRKYDLDFSPSKNTESKNGKQSKSPDLFTSPKSRVITHRRSSQSPISKCSTKQTSTSPVNSASPSVASTNASPKIRTIKNSSPLVSPRASSRTSSSISPKPSSRVSSRASPGVSPKHKPSTPRSRKSSLGSPTPSPKSNPSPSTPKGRKNLLASPLPSPTVSNTSVYSTALSSIASPSPVKEIKNSGNKNTSLQSLKSPLTLASSRSSSVSGNSNLNETEGKQIYKRKLLDGEIEQTFKRERRKSSKHEIKEEEKGGKIEVNYKSNEVSEKGMEVKEEKVTSLKRRSLPSTDKQNKTDEKFDNTVNESKEEPLKESDKKSTVGNKGSKEDIEIDTPVINVDNAASKRMKRKSELVDDIPTLTPRRSRRISEVPESQDEFKDIFPRRSSRRSEVNNIKEAQNETKNNKDDGKGKKEAAKKANRRRSEITDIQGKNELNLPVNRINISQNSDVNVSL